MRNYKYIYYTTGAISIESDVTMNQVELNRLTRFLFGQGAAANSVFNCDVSAFIKFQSRPELNKPRAFLTTKAWRYCHKHNIKVSHENFKSRRFNNDIEPTFETFLNYVKSIS